LKTAGIAVKLAMKVLKQLNALLLEQPLSVKGFKGTVSNRICLSKDGGSLEITPTVPLNGGFPLHFGDHCNI